MRCVRSVAAWVGVGALVLGVGVGEIAGAAKAPAKPPPKGRGVDLKVIEYERWLDTIKGTVKNVGKSPARDVTVEVKFLDKKRKPLGAQRVSVGDLHPGDESSFSIPIAEKYRQAKQYEFTAGGRQP